MVSVSRAATVGHVEGATSSVSWSAIIAGALAASALSLALLILGAGLGLSMVSPWSAEGFGATTVAASAIVWLVILQWASSGVGGYVAGRLRNRWSGLLGDEVLFRDTAHGLLVWALATVMVALLLGSGGAAAIRGGGAAVASVAAASTDGKTANAALPTDYFADMLFRPVNAPSTTGINATSVDPSGDGAKAEAMRIMVVGLAKGDVSPADKAQLTHLVATRTGMTAADAQQRVDDVLTRIEAAKSDAKVAADKARKVGLTLALMTALSLFVGAFIAGVAAAIGGRQRNEF